MNIALIKAGGVGSRMGAEVPKQFIAVNGKPVIVYTLEEFEHHPAIDAIVVVCVDGWHDTLRSYIRKFNITKVRSIVSGGETSLRSIREGLREARRLFSDDDLVLVHDANRPMTSEDIISDVIAKATIHGSAVAAIPTTDEVMQQEGTTLSSTVFLDHKVLYRIQTPDAYRLGYVSNLLENATDDQLDNLGATNTLAIASGGRVFFAQGSELNIRLTTKEDILLFQTLLLMKDNGRRS